MGKISEFIERRTGWSADDEKWWHEIGWLRRSATGVQVTETSALYSSAVYACVRLLAETIASLPLPVYHRLVPRGKERAYNHPLYSLLHNSPNPWTTSYSFRETLQGHLATWGNAYAEIDWDMATGRVRALWQLRPDRMKVGRENNQLIYVYQLPDGTPAKLPAYRVWHIPGFGFDGLVGYSPIQLAREAIGLSMATEEFGARFFGNGASPGGVLEHPNKLKGESEENLRNSWNEMHQGLGNQHRIAILEEGMKYHQVSIPPEDAQFLETRKFQTNEIARFFHIPPHMIGDLDRATFSNIEQQSLEFVIYTIRPWLVRWEQSAHQKLMGPEERQSYFVEFLVEGLLRGDAAARSAYYNQMFMVGAMSPNDIRDKENMNPLEGGDETFVPMNMIPASMASMPLPKPAANYNSERLLPAAEENRSSRSALLRARTAASYRHVFEDAAQRIVEHEKNAVLRAAKKYLGEREATSFNDWLTDFYRDFPEYIGRQIKRPAQGMAEAIQQLAADEIKAEPDKAEMDKFVGEYVGGFNLRYASSSKGQLQALVREAADAGEPPLPAVETRLEEWGLTRPGKVAFNETVQLSNAVAKIVFAGAGITKLVWHALGSDSCPICQEMDGRVVGIEEDFVAANTVLQSEGQSPMKAFRPSSHAPLHQGCLPGDSLVLAEGITASSERWYDGNLIVIYTASGHKLTCTPNHPVLTDTGWVPAGNLHVRNNVISCRFIDGYPAVISDHQNMPALIHDIAESFCQSAEMVTIPVPIASEDFHGDGRDGEITIIRANRKLLDKGATFAGQQFSQPSFSIRNAGQFHLPPNGSFSQICGRHLATLGCLMSSHDLPLSFFRGHSLPVRSNVVSLGSDFNARGNQVVSDDSPGNLMSASNLLNSLSSKVVRDEIIWVEQYPFHGNVYNLHTQNHYYLADGIIVHNCVCQIGPA
ncbi:MAG TPA: phage portal protein [Dehalococcoidales bacterium]|nr:phage portal protein [Dehalococcoidales bacterium]